MSYQREFPNGFTWWRGPRRQYKVVGFNPSTGKYTVIKTYYLAPKGTRTTRHFLSGVALAYKAKTSSSEPLWYIVGSTPHG